MKSKVFFFVFSKKHHSFLLTSIKCHNCPPKALPKQLQFSTNIVCMFIAFPSLLVFQEEVQIGWGRCLTGNRLQGIQIQRSQRRGGSDEFLYSASASDYHRIFKMDYFQTWRCSESQGSEKHELFMNL